MQEKINEIKLQRGIRNMAREQVIQLRRVQEHFL